MHLIMASFPLKRLTDHSPLRPSFPARPVAFSQNGSVSPCVAPGTYLLHLLNQNGIEPTTLFVVFA